MEISEAKDKLYDFMQIKLQLYCGLRQWEKMEEKERMLWIKEMCSKLLSKPWIDANRFDIIMKKGATGAYGEFTSVSLMTFTKWIDCYYRDNQNEVDKDIRSGIIETEQKKSDTIQYWYEKGIERFTNIYNEAKAAYLKNPTQIDHTFITEDLDRGEIWWKVFEEAGLVSVDHQRDNALIKRVDFMLNREANSNSEFKINIPSGSVMTLVKSILLRQLLVDFIKDKVAIEMIYDQYSLLDIRKRNFFLPVVKNV